MLAQSDLESASSARVLAARYDLIVFPGHHEYVTAREYDLVEGYRDLGGTSCSSRRTTSSGASRAPEPLSRRRSYGGIWAGPKPP